MATKKTRAFKFTVLLDLGDAYDPETFQAWVSTRTRGRKGVEEAVQKARVLANDYLGKPFPEDDLPNYLVPLCVHRGHLWDYSRHD